MKLGHSRVVISGSAFRIMSKNKLWKGKEMKTDRILEIIIYLMNHDNVSASYLAERFHVSVRTIQRDMISISAIGVPIYSENGKMAEIPFCLHTRLRTVKSEVKSSR